MGEMWREPSGFERRAVIARLAVERPDFIVNTGDLVAVGSSEPQWEIFDIETQPLRAAGIGYLPVLGNHDLWPDDADGLANWFARFAHLEGQRWSQVRYGSITILLLDSNESWLTSAQEAEQDEWLAARLHEADADPLVRCVILVCHQPPITNSYAHGTSSWVRSHFVELAHSHPKVKAFINGHVHSYEHFVERGIHFLVSGGGGAPLMNVAGPRGKFPDLYDGPRGHHFCRVIPREDRIDVEMERMDDAGAWSIADRWSIQLP